MIDCLKPYTQYKESGLGWTAKLPAHWSTERAKWLFTKMDRPVRPGDEVVTCFRDGTVTLRRNRRLRGFTEAIFECGYQGIRKGDLVIHAMDAFAGAIGVSDSNGKGTPVYAVCQPQVDVNAYYFASIIREMSRSSWIQSLSRGIRERSTDFRFDMFGNQRVPVPPSDEQATIVRFLDRATGRFESYLRTKRKELALVSEMLLNVTQHTLQSPGTRAIRLSAAAEVMSRPLDRRAGASYTPIGLYNRGRGIFHKETKDGSELGDSDFFLIEDGDLVLSGQFAWEGAVALARANDSGCVASHRYPILRGRREYATSATLLALFRTPYGAMLLDHHSRGAAGRNRPLNARSLLKEKVPVPPLSVQARIAELLVQEHSVAQALAQAVRFVQEYRARLVADVVTGKLDVREAARQLPVTQEEIRVALNDEELEEEVDA